MGLAALTGTSVGRGPGAGVLTGRLSQCGPPIKRGRKKRPQANLCACPSVSLSEAASGSESPRRH
jgi:hypothetical protein